MFGEALFWADLIVQLVRVARYVNGLNISRRREKGTICSYLYVPS